MVGYVGFSCWLFLVLGFIIFGIVLLVKKYVSLSSIVTTIASIIMVWGMVIFIHFVGVGQSAFSVENPLGSWTFGANIFRFGFGYVMDFGTGIEMAACQTIAGAIIIYRHKANILRLKKGEERKVSWLK